MFLGVQIGHARDCMSRISRSCVTSYVVPQNPSKSENMTCPWPQPNLDHHPLSAVPAGFCVKKVFVWKVKSEVPVAIAVLQDISLFQRLDATSVTAPQTTKMSLCEI
jgi:hypothetical protein